MGDYMRTGSSPPRASSLPAATKGTEDAKSNKAAEEKMKLGKVENRETEIRIDQYILAREKRETTRKKIRT
jgi:hypothetical protein